MKATIAVAVRHRVVAFEAPLHEHKALRAVYRAFKTSFSVPGQATSTSFGSVAITDAEVFRYVTFFLSPDGSKEDPQTARHLLTLLAMYSTKEVLYLSATTTLLRWQDAEASYTVSTDPTLATSTDRVFVLVTYRPRELLPLYMASARRAVRFVNAVVALVTANAYVSTLGGGHFLCRHLNESTQLANVQIGISMSLHDPVLESKCRVNLLYNALQFGRFKRARRMLKREQAVAEQLESRELRSVCHAASVYLEKMATLHQEQRLTCRKRGLPGTLYDNFYRQRILRLAP
ncbi:hypothetical protein CCR75_000554 [Bremia lactucae]|uniref:Uncharacterized protein n=1 Tax=Bremia lactucae TaxID=4779 RepID=A0A976NYR6_BRELC|nr:hypothetical protein CCR75_000554 [Bremia lactucae]